MHSIVTSGALWNEKLVLVTGGASFLGSYLVEKLMALGVQVRVPIHRGGVRVEGAEYVKGDVSDPGFTATLFQDVDHVFHLASHRKNVAYHKEHREEIFAANVALTQALMQSMPTKKIPVTFFSTALLATLPSEETPVEDIPDGYLAAKLACERLWKQACTELLIVRPVSAYGPRDRFNTDGNVIPALMVRCAEAEKELTVWGSGKQKRAFVYAEDVAKATLELIGHDASGSQYLCPPECKTIGELAAMIRDLVKPGIDLSFDASKPEGPNLCALPVHSSLTSFPWVSLQDGLLRTLDWWKKNS